MFEFENPFAFLVLLLIPLFYVFRLTGIFKRISFPIILSDWNGHTFDWKKSRVGFSSILSRIFFFAGFLLVAGALAKPSVQKQENVYTSRGADIIFVVDTSPSMAALDIGSSNRLSAAKQTISILADEMQGVSFGLVAMASEAALIVPPTQDTASFSERMNDVKIGELGEGTAIGIGLGTAVYHLTSSNAPKKCIVLLTDGENNAGAVHPVTAANLARENDITVYAVALGTQGTVAVEYTDPHTGSVRSGYMDSHFDITALREISTAGGGQCYTAENVSTLTETLNAIARKENVAQTFQIRTITKYYYFEALSLASVLIAIAWIIRRMYLKEIA